MHNAESSIVTSLSDGIILVKVMSFVVALTLKSLTKSNFTLNDILISIAHKPQDYHK